MLNKLTPVFSLITLAFEHVYRFVFNLFVSLKQKVSAIAEFMKVPNLLAWASNYTPSQWCYFLSAFLLAISIFTQGDFFNLAALLAFIGLLRELSNIFHKIWDNTAGKGLIILLYASTANLALAFAALKINHITGIEPSPFIFTLGFTTLVLMPFWIALSSIVVFLLVLVLANLWLFISLLLRLIGFKVAVHWEDKKRAFLTMILRIILIPLVLVHLATIMLPYASGDLADYLGVEGEEIWINFDPETTESDLASNKALSEVEENQKVASGNAIAKSEAEATPSDEQELVDNLQQKQKLIESMIAHFIFYLESYSRSACTKAEDQHSVIIDENMVLLIRKNEEALHGYDYEVTECVPRY